MRVWVDVYDPSGVKLGTAYDVYEANVEKALDAGGSFDLTFPTSSQVTSELLAQENRVTIWVEQDDQTRILGSGVIRERTPSTDESGSSVTVSGPDLLDDLTRKSVLLRRLYTAETISNVVADLISLVTGWTGVTDAGLGSVTARFDGTSVLKALLRLAEESGLHLREGSEPKTLEFGAFGEDSGVVAINPGEIFPELYEADDRLLINNIEIKTNSKGVVNWVIPLGAGDRDEELTLEGSTPAASTLTGPDGTLLYYVTDDDSIDSYGQIERILNFKEITDPDLLYAAAVAWLDLNSQPLVTYSIEAEKCRTALKPGYLLPVKYKHVVETDTDPFAALEVNDTFWIMKVKENISTDGMSLSLDVASVPRYEPDDNEIVVNAIEAINVRTVNVNNNIGYIKIHEEQNSGTDGGTFTSGAWQTRVLNRIVNNDNNHASLANNQITLDRGSYEYNAMAPAALVGVHQLRLYNITTSAEMDVGSNAVANVASTVTTHAFVNGKFTIEDATVFELQHRATTTRATNGLGLSSGWGTEVYAVIEFRKTD